MAHDDSEQTPGNTGGIDYEWNKREIIRTGGATGGTTGRTHVKYAPLPLRPLTFLERLEVLVTGRSRRYERTLRTAEELAETRINALSVSDAVTRSVARITDAERAHYNTLRQGEERLALFVRGYYGAEIERGQHNGMGTVFDAAVYYMGRERQYAHLFRRLPAAIQSGPGSAAWGEMLAAMADILMQEGK